MEGERRGGCADPPKTTKNGGHSSKLDNILLLGGVEKKNPQRGRTHKRTTMDGSIYGIREKGMILRIHCPEPAGRINQDRMNLERSGPVLRNLNSKVLLFLGINGGKAWGKSEM